MSDKVRFWFLLFLLVASLTLLYVANSNLANHVVVGQ